MPTTMYDDASPGPPTPQSLDPPSLSPDELFHTLQNERRRFVIRYMLDQSGPVDVPSLVDQVAAWELQTTVAELPDDERQRIYVDIFQSQLPKLDQQGFVDYDESRGVVESAPALQAVDTRLLAGLPAEQEQADTTADADRAWLDYYALATGVSALLVVVAAFGPLLAVSLSFEVVAAAVTSLYAALTTGLFVERAF